MNQEFLNTILQNIHALQHEAGGIHLELQSGDSSPSLMLKYGSQTSYFHLIYKNQIVPAHIPALKQTIDQPASVFVLAAYISPRAKQMLRELHISYADSVGNLFVKTPSIFLFIEKNKTNRSKLTEGSRLLTPAGIKVIFLLLVYPEYINKPYRFIAPKATVTIDTVGKVIRGLLKEKFIYQLDEGFYEFANREQLFINWVTAFNRKLRPKLKQGYFTCIDKDVNWERVTLPDNSLWGGVSAANNLTNELIPNKWIIYTGQPFQMLMKELKLIPEENGEILLIEKFWKGSLEKSSFVHPFLIYADLLNEDDPRYLKMAEKIYLDYVKNKL